MIQLLFFLAGVLTLSPEITFAGIEEGLAAAKKNDFATALEEFQPLAEQGSASAQYYLGTLYLNGTGVTRNAEEAVKWISRSAGQGLQPRKPTWA
jgi:TPR repeat protein